jgi:HEAT repeat protein
MDNDRQIDRRVARDYFHRRGDMADNLDSVVLSSLEQEDPNRLRAACLMAGLLGIKEAERGLLKALTHKAWQVQAEAARALGRVGATGALPFLKRLLKAADAELRTKILASVAPGKGEEAAGEAHPEAKRAAAVAISRLDPKVAEETLLGALAADNPSLLAAAMAGLANLDSPSGRERMLELLGHGEASVRRAAAAALGRLHESRAVGGLIGLLDDPQADVRKEALIALNQIKDREALGPLVERLEDGDAEVRRVAAIALANTRAKGGLVVEALARGLNDRDPGVRAACLSALANLRAGQYLEQVALLLGDTHEAVARQAAVTVTTLAAIRERPEYEGD